MQRFRADLRQIDTLNIANQGSTLHSPILPRKRLSNREINTLKSAIVYGKSFSPQIGLLGELIEITERPPPIMIIPPVITPVSMMSSHGPITHITVGLGLEHSIFAVIGGSIQAGFYGSTIREVGVFTSLGLGLWSNVGVGLGPTITIVFGPPSEFAGIAWGIGADAGTPGKIVSGSGMLLFSAPPFRFLGVSFGLAVGVSCLPEDVTVQVSTTVTKPVLKWK